MNLPKERNSHDSGNVTLLLQRDRLDILCWTVMALS